VREKIRDVVADPETARKLIPTGYPIGTKRLPLDQGYFETYNRDNVSLVDLRETPIERIAENGIRTSDQLHELDAIVFATGFDAMTGPLLRLNISGRGGQKLGDKWTEGPKTYLGLQSVGFPNLFMITGPGSPSVLGNMPTSIEQHVEFICDALAHVEKQGASTIEPTPASEQQWGVHVKELADATLFPQADSWYMGANIPGKPRVFTPYIGGFGTYRRLCNEIVEKGFEGFTIG
jgi:cyclohexanone monooxygenase